MACRLSLISNGEPAHTIREAAVACDTSAMVCEPLRILPGYTRNHMLCAAKGRRF